MPEGGRVGWYADWYGETDGHFSPQWETFHVRQLIPWIDANFDTKATREGRALVGLSMGGLGTVRAAGDQDRRRRQRDPRENGRFHNELVTAGIDHRFCSGYGEHSWPYWQNDFEDFLRFAYGDTPSSSTTNPGWTERPGPTSPV